MMCDVVVISTDSLEDLSKIPHDTAGFTKDTGYEKPINRLKYANRYRLIELEHPCGCYFRTVDPNFGIIEPQDWHNEDDDVLYNTYFAYDTIKRLLNEGYKVDCLSIWTSQTPEDTVHDYGKLNLDEVSRVQFAFLFQHYFEYELE